MLAQAQLMVLLGGAAAIFDDPLVHSDWIPKLNSRQKNHKGLSRKNNRPSGSAPMLREGWKVPERFSRIGSKGPDQSNARCCYQWQHQQALIPASSALQKRLPATCQAIETNLLQFEFPNCQNMPIL